MKYLIIRTNLDLQLDEPEDSRVYTHKIGGEFIDFEEAKKAIDKNMDEVIESDASDRFDSSDDEEEIQEYKESFYRNYTKNQPEIGKLVTIVELRYEDYYLRSTYQYDILALE